MLPSLTAQIDRLSKLQREFLIDHVDGIRPFTNQPIENATRESLLVRKLIRLEPRMKTILGKPDGTVLTDYGREALSYALGDMADNLVRALEASSDIIDLPRERALYCALHDAARHWREYSDHQLTLKWGDDGENIQDGRSGIDGGSATSRNESSA